MNAKIDLLVGYKSGRSYLRSLYVTPPFRVVSVGQLASDTAAYLMQMSTSPGVLSGDRYQINITVEDHARLQFKSQSYQRLYDMEEHAEQVTQIQIGDSAHYSQVPHPIVPQRNSSFTSLNRVVMGENSSFLQSEIITCGRKYHGEEFLFRELSNSVEVRTKDGRLRLKDRVWLSPTQTPLLECGLLEGYTHQGTLIFQSTEERDLTEAIEHIHTMISVEKEIKFGISKTHKTGYVLRVLGNRGEQLFELFTSVQQYMWSKTT